MAKSRNLCLSPTQRGLINQSINPSLVIRPITSRRIVLTMREMIVLLFKLQSPHMTIVMKVLVCWWLETKEELVHPLGLVVSDVEDFHSIFYNIFILSQF